MVEIRARKSGGGGDADGDGGDSHGGCGGGGGGGSGESGGGSSGGICIARGSGDDLWERAMQQIARALFSLSTSPLAASRTYCTHLSYPTVVASCHANLGAHDSRNLRAHAPTGDGERFESATLWG